MGPPSSLRITRVRRYFGYWQADFNLNYATFTLFGVRYKKLRLSLSVPTTVHNPWCISTPGLASSAFARHYSQNLGWFLFLALLRCFSSGGSPRIPMYSVYVYQAFPWQSSLIRIPADRSLFAAPRSFSQLIASFFGFWCQGIHPVLFLAWTSWAIANLFFRSKCLVLNFCFTLSYQFLDLPLCYVVVIVTLMFPWNLILLDLLFLHLCFIQFSMYNSWRFLVLVGSSGLEPPTSRLSGARSSLLSYEPVLIVLTYSCSLGEIFWFPGGDEEIRTLDPLLAGQVLSQLSYTPGSFQSLGLWKSNNEIQAT